MNKPDWLTVGIIVKPQGLKGEVRVKSRTDFPETRFAPDSQLTLFHDSFSSPRRVTVERYRPHKGIFVVKFRELNAFEEVEPLCGATLKIAREDIHALDEHEYYFYEIIGCEVFTTEGERLGTIDDILQPGANDVWVVKRAGMKQL